MPEKYAQHTNSIRIGSNGNVQYLPQGRFLPLSVQAELLSHLPFPKRLALHLKGYVLLPDAVPPKGCSYEVYLCEDKGRMWLDYKHGFDEAFYLPSGSL